MLKLIRIFAFLLIVMLGGPAMNMVLGVLLTAVLLMGFGVATATTTGLGSSPDATPPTAKMATPAASR